MPIPTDIDPVRVGVWEALLLGLPEKEGEGEREVDTDPLPLALPPPSTNPTLEPLGVAEGQREEVPSAV